MNSLSSNQVAFSRQTIPFSTLDGRSIAVLLRQGERTLVFRGKARLQHDDVLGDIVTITEREPPRCGAELVISQETWKGRILPDLDYGCDWCMIPDN